MHLHKSWPSQHPFVSPWPGRWERRSHLPFFSRSDRKGASCNHRYWGFHFGPCWQRDRRGLESGTAGWRDARCGFIPASLSSFRARGLVFPSPRRIQRTRLFLFSCWLSELRLVIEFFPTRFWNSIFFFFFIRISNSGPKFCYSFLGLEKERERERGRGTDRGKIDPYLPI